MTGRSPESGHDVCAGSRSDSTEGTHADHSRRAGLEAANASSRTVRLPLGMTRYAVLADVHGNLPALQSVFAAVEGERVDAIVCAGDVVGYGAMPNECVAELARRDAIAVAGNHDLMAIDVLSTERTSRAAALAIRWTRQALDDASRSFLRALPVRASPHDLLVAHGSLDDTSEYVRLPEQASEQLRRMGSAAAEARVLVLGHTHHPMIVSERRGLLARRAPARVRFDRDERVLVNPGSVGQSRDRWPRARFAIVDTALDEVVLHSLRYDVARARRALRAHDLPPRGVHAPPHANSPFAVALVRASPEPLRRAYRAARRTVVR